MRRLIPFAMMLVLGCIPAVNAADSKFEQNLTVGQIEIEGNYECDESEIRSRLCVEPGDRFDRTVCMDGLWALDELNRFHSMQITPRLNQNNVVDLYVYVDASSNYKTSSHSLARQSDIYPSGSYFVGCRRTKHVWTAEADPNAPKEPLLWGLSRNHNVVSPTRFGAYEYYRRHPAYFSWYKRPTDSWPFAHISSSPCSSASTPALLMPSESPTTFEFPRLI